MVLALLVCSMLISSSVQAQSLAIQPGSSDIPGTTIPFVAAPSGVMPSSPPHLGLPPRDFVPGPLRAGTAPAPMTLTQAEPSRPAAMPLAHPPVIDSYSTCAPGTQGATSAAAGRADMAAVHPWRAGTRLLAKDSCTPPFTIGPGTVVTPATLAQATGTGHASAQAVSLRCVALATCVRTGRAASAARSAAVTNPVITQVNVVACCAANNGQSSAVIYVWGSGFGHNPILFAGGGCGATSGVVSPDLGITDTTRGWNAGGTTSDAAHGSCVTVGVAVWNDSYAVFQLAQNYGAAPAYWFHSGDNASVTIINPQTGGSASGNGTTGTPLTIPPSALPDANRTCPCGRNAPLALPFNTRTGDLYTASTDLQVSSPGPQLAWARTYNSQATGDADASRSLGYGWTQPYGTHLVTASMAGGEPGTAIVVTAEGNRERFVDQGGGTFQAYPGVYATLVGSGGTYTETMPDQRTITFNSGGQATVMADGHGGSLVLSYSGANLIKVTDAINTGRYLSIDYKPDGLHIADVKDPANRTVQYNYDTVTGDLTQVTDVMNRTVSYSYNTHLLRGCFNKLL